MENGSQSSLYSRYNQKSSSGNSSSTTREVSYESFVSTPDKQSPIPIIVQKIQPDAQLLGEISEKLAKEIRDEFMICKICLDQYDRPKCLACLHTFCQSCIENHISAEVTYKKTTDYHHFTCPICRKHTTLSIGGVKKLPDNFLISGLGEILSRQRITSQLEVKQQDIRNNETYLTTNYRAKSDQLGGETLIHPNFFNKFDITSIKVHEECEICGQLQDNNRGRSIAPLLNGSQVSNLARATSANVNPVSIAFGKCFDCNKLLCSQCVKRHKEMKVTRDHPIFDLAAEKSIACQDHPGEPVRFYCTACSKCICVVCTFNYHREHEVTSFGEAVIKLRSDLQKMVVETEITLAKGRRWLALLDEFGEYVNKIENEIKEATDKAIDQLRFQEDELLEELHQNIGRGTLQIIERLPEWECQLSNLERVHNELSDLLEGQDIEILLTRADIKEKHAKLSQLEITGNLIEISPFNIIYKLGSVIPGKLIFNEYGSSSGELHIYTTNLVNISRAINQSVSISCQTDEQLNEQLTEVSPPPPITPIKEFRHRASNTNDFPKEDKETNTRPRGTQISISFGGEEQLEVVENYLTAFQQLELVGQESAFAAMDNLTRARIRRKLKERWSTMEDPSCSISLVAETENNDNLGFRRHSNLDSAR